jgi:serine/threonine protein kinase
MSVGVGTPSGASDTPSERIVDGWRVGEQLGTGSFGDVYLVRDVDTGARAALKLFDEGLEAGGCLTELELLFDAEHPNLVEILSFGYTSGRKYIVYEYVGGGNLRDFLVRHNRVAPETALRLLTEAARGLAFAHDQSIVHRDLKPENLLLTEPEWPTTVKLCDFGLSARAAPEQRLEDSYGSPAYMAPEQLEGNYDHRADIYAIGVMLYEMLFGRRPLTGDASAIAHAHKHVGVPLPDGGSPAIRRVLEQTMASDPEARYGRAEAMIDDFESALEALETGEASSHVSPPNSEQLAFERRWTARLTGRVVGREGTRDGTLLLAIQGRLVAMTLEGKLYEMSRMPSDVSEVLAGGTATQTVGWRQSEEVTLFRDGERYEWSLEAEVAEGVYELVIGPLGERVAVRTPNFVQLHELDGTVCWRATVDTYGLLPGLCFADGGERLWISSEVPRTQLYSLSREGDPLVRTSAPDHEVSLHGGEEASVWVLCHGDERLCRVGPEGFIEAETDLFESPTGLHVMGEDRVGASSVGHLEVLNDTSLESRSLARYPAPEEPAIIGKEGLFQTSAQDGYTLVEYWGLETVGT